MNRLSFTFLFIILVCTLSFAQTNAPTPLSTPASNPTPLPGAGDIWVEPETSIVGTGEEISLEIHANTGTERLGGYKLWLYYDPYILSLHNITAGADGYISSIGQGPPGTYVIVGFDPSGTGPGSNLHVITIVFQSSQSNCGETFVDIEIDDFTDSEANTIGTPQAYDGTVTITGCSMIGDVNGDQIVDVTDALLTAQYYVGLDVDINTGAADANCDGSVTIIDALLIAQYYVGIISSFCS